MATIAEIRQKYPQYEDMSDQQLADGMHKKFYSDMPQNDFYSKIGFAPQNDGSVNGDNLNAAAINGVPIVGPYLLKAGAAIDATLDRTPIGSNAIPGETWGERYDNRLNSVEGNLDEFGEQHPYIKGGAEVAGGVIGMAPAVMAWPAAFGAGGGAGLAGLATNMGAGALSGGAIGGADAAVRSDFDPKASLKGGLTGIGIGAVAPIAGRAVGAGVNAVRNSFGGPSQAQQALSRAAAADGVDDIAARLTQMGPDAMPMDLGPNLRSQAGALAGTPGNAQKTIRTAISERQAGAGQRVSSALDDALGQPVDTIALADDIIARRSAEAKPLYEAAYSKPVPFSRELDELLRRPTVGKALKKAQGLAADEGIPSQQWFATVSDDGKVGIVNVPDVRQLDLTKRALDDMISSAQRAGNNNEARIFTQQKDLLTKIVDKAVPEYGQARKAFSGPAAVLDALEEGQNVFKNKMTPNQVRTKMLTMGDAEREAFIQGGRAAVADTMGGARNDALKGIQTFESGYNKEKLALLVDKQRADQMLQALDTEQAFRLSKDRVTGNSETFSRAQAAKDIGANAKEPGAIRELLNMNPGNAAAKFGDKFLGKAQTAAQEKINDELARYLTVKPGDKAMLKRAIEFVQQSQRRGDITADQAVKFVVNAQQQFGQKHAQPSKPLEITVRPNR